MALVYFALAVLFWDAACRNQWNSRFVQWTNWASFACLILLAGLELLK